MISLDQARYHLRIDSTAHDAEIEVKLNMAHAVVRDYCSSANYGGNWAVQDAAALLVLGELWLNRESSSAAVISPAIRGLLERERAPAFA